ncbi:MAG: hypothetical protein ACLQG3_02485 [Terracidiphilus sp.]
MASGAVAAKKALSGSTGAAGRSAHGLVRTGRRVQESIRIAEARGLFEGGRTLVVRGRMPAALVAHAKRKTGITSDSRLLEAALASIAVADDYGEWLISQRSTIAPELDLEF